MSIHVDIAETLAGATKKNPISSSEIRDKFGIEDAPGNPVTRAFIFETMACLRIPIGANVKGYWILMEQDEVDDYLKSLNTRVEGIMRRANMVQACWKELQR